jgi:hypothetical protein
MMDMMVTTTTSKDITNSNATMKVRDAPSQRENSSAPQEHPNSYYSNTGLVAQAAHCMMNAYVTVCQKQKTASGRSDVVEKAQALFLQLDQDKVITHTGGTSLRTCGVCVGAVQRRSLNLCVWREFWNFHSVFYIHIELTVTHRLIFIFEQFPFEKFRTISSGSDECLRSSGESECCTYHAVEGKIPYR